MSLLLLLALLGFTPTAAQAESISSITVAWSTTTAPLIVNAYAHRYGVPFDELWGTIQCEDPALEPAARGDHDLARGVAQIRSDFFPSITDAQADDPYFAVEFLAKAFKDGHASWWSCWRAKFGAEQS